MQRLTAVGEPGADPVGVDHAVGGRAAADDVVGRGLATDGVVAVVALEVVRRGNSGERADRSLVAPHHVVADLAEGGVLVGVALDLVRTTDAGVEQRDVPSEHIATGGR